MTVQAERTERDYLTESVQIIWGYLRLFTLFIMSFLVLLSLGGCASSGITPIPETAITPELDQLLEGYFAAYNDYDVDALKAVITDGYVLYEGRSFSNLNVSSPVCEDYEAAEMFLYVEGYNKENEYHFERLGEPIMSGDGPWIVSQVLQVSWKDHPNGVSGISTFTIVDEDGTPKVARDIFVGFYMK